MPPRGGRGRGRGASRGSRAATARAHRTGRIPFTAKLNGHSHDQNGVHALFESPGLLIVAGLLPHHFPDYDSAQSADTDSSHSDYGSATVRTSRKMRGITTTANNKDADAAADERMHGAEHASNPGNDGDWTETDVEVFVAPKTRGFYRPPPRREVVRQRVRRSESSRYNDAVPKVRRQSPSVEPFAVETEEAPLSTRRSSQKSSQAIEEIPAIVEQEATEDEEEVEKIVRPNYRGRGGRGRGRGGRGRGRKATPPPPAPRPEIIDEGELSDSNFPDAYLPKVPVPSVRHCEDKADWIQKRRFLPMAHPQDFITGLTKVDPATRSTRVLYEIALNAQRALVAWQDEYLKLDLVTAPKSNPPKKPLTGGRPTVDPLVYDDMLEAELYGYTYDMKKLPGMQDPFRQRAGGGKFVGGRELRQRRGRDVGAVDLSEHDMDENEGYGTRRRRAAQRQQEAATNVTTNQLEVPLRRGVKRTVSNGPSDITDGPPRKRGRPSAAEKNAMQARVQQLREESAAVSGYSEPEGQSPEPERRRGRPPGSKNTMPRSDAGIKKGPRTSRFASAAEDEEEASQAGYVDGNHYETRMSYPSMHESMEIDGEDELPITTNGSSVHSRARGKAVALTNGDPTPLFEDRASTGTSTSTPAADTKDPKKRVRSEKRSKSMTEWWAARKAKAAEDRKLQLAQQAEADRAAEEQARATHAAQQAQAPPQQDARYWPNIAPQHGKEGFVGPPPPQPLQREQQHVPRMAFTGPQPSKDRVRGPPHVPQAAPAPVQHVSHNLPPPQHVHQPHGSPPGRRPDPMQMSPQQVPASHAPAPTQLGPPQASQVPVPPQHMHQGPPRMLYQPPPQTTLPPPAPATGPPPGPPSLIHHAPPLPLHRPPSASFATSPTQGSQQHVFHHHPAPPPPPPNSIQYSPPQQYQGPGRQPSPLRRIINYVSDPSKAAQPAGPPYQTIMTPGAAMSPTIIQHHGHQLSRPGSRGRTPPPASSSTAAQSLSQLQAPQSLPAPPSSTSSAGPLMSAFHINNTAGRPPIPGTGSFRPDTPGKSTFTHYTVYTPPGLSRSTPQPNAGGRMTGAQVQDLALAAVQPVARKPIEDVLKEQQREWAARSVALDRERERERETEPSRPSVFSKLQTAPPSSSDASRPRSATVALAARASEHAKRYAAEAASLTKPAPTPASTTLASRPPSGSFGSDANRPPSRTSVEPNRSRSRAFGESGLFGPRRTPVSSILGGSPGLAPRRDLPTLADLARQYGGGLGAGLGKSMSPPGGGGGIAGRQRSASGGAAMGELGQPSQIVRVGSAMAAGREEGQDTKEGAGGGSG